MPRKRSNSIRKLKINSTKKHNPPKLSIDLKIQKPAKVEDYYRAFDQKNSN